MISVIAFPRRGDSYTECFYPALEGAGVSVREGVFAGRWLLENLRDVDFAHIHWPSFAYSDAKPGRCLRRFALFVFFLALARVRGVRLVWTVHNLFPHDPCVVPGLHKLARRLVVAAASRFLIHSPAAAREVERAFPSVAGRTVLIDHGHWRGYYPDTISRETARRELGLAPDDYAVLFIGLCKPYKNLEALIDAVQHLPERAVLVIAGRFQDPAYEQAIRARIAGSKTRIIFRPGFVPDDQLQLYLKACDVVALPYRESLTSGGAMLALTFGRPVVAPKFGFLTDVITADTGVLYERFDRGALAEALMAAMRTPFDESRIIEVALARDWNKTAETVRSALIQTLKPARIGRLSPSAVTAAGVAATPKPQSDRSQA